MCSDILEKITTNQHIYLGIGSSIGNAEEIFKNAQKYLEKNGIKIIKKSSIHKTKPWGGIAENNFSNAVWAINILSKSFAQKPYKKSIQLLNIIHQSEKKAGRNRDIEKKWGDRPLDIDILWFPGLICDTKRLTLPRIFDWKCRRNF